MCIHNSCLTEQTCSMCKGLPPLNSNPGHLTKENLHLLGSGHATNKFVEKQTTGVSRTGSEASRMLVGFCLIRERDNS